MKGKPNACPYCGSRAYLYMRKGVYRRKQIPNGACAYFLMTDGMAERVALACKTFRIKNRSEFFRKATARFLSHLEKVENA